MEECQDESKNAEPDSRSGWSSSLEFLMSCISVSVGLGNIWRFPFVAYENGGGAFLIPYIVVLFLIGKPVYFMEVLLGQFTSKSSVKVWSICPAFVGVGIGQAYAGVAVLTYYSSLIALTLYYLVVSMQETLPWSYCREEWGPICVDSTSKVDALPNNTKLQSSSELYFLKVVIRETDDISNGIGNPSWQLTIALFFAWFVTFLIIARGVKTTGKAAYFLAIFPYVILITLLIRAVTLEGAIDGIIFFLKPKWGELLNLKVWKAAVVQCFFSLAVGLGPIIMFSSFNKFTHNVHRDAIIVTTLDTVTSFIAGITIFGILGNLAYNLNISNIEEVVRSGTGLAFISYPNAISNFSVLPQLFAVLFFFMLFVLGIGTLVAQANTLVIILCDHFKWLKTWMVALATTVGGFLLAIVYVTPVLQRFTYGALVSVLISNLVSRTMPAAIRFEPISFYEAGQWILNLVDYYACTFVIFGLAVFQTIGVSWIYGLRNFCNDVEFMLKRRISYYWRICWAVVTPIFLLFMFIYSMTELETLTYANMEYPLSANIAGWVLLSIGFLQFFLWVFWVLFRKFDGSFSGAVKRAFSPDEDWGPNDENIKKEWIIYKSNITEKLRAEYMNSRSKIISS